MFVLVLLYDSFTVESDTVIPRLLRYYHSKWVNFYRNPAVTVKTTVVPR